MGIYLKTHRSSNMAGGLSSTVSCLYCNDTVDINRDYKNHLNTVHKAQNVEECMQLAVEKLEQEKKRRVIEEITIDDDDSEDDDQKEEYAIDIKVEKNFISDEKSEMRKVAIETANELFGYLRLLEIRSDKDVKNYIKKCDYSPLLNDEDGITKYFSKLKEKVIKFELPSEMLEKLKPDICDNTNVEVEGDKIRKNVVERNYYSQPCILFDTTDQLQTHIEDHKVSVVSQNKSKDTSNRITKQEKRFVCPLPKCSFWTDKMGMKGKGKAAKAAIHLSKDHMIKPKDMTPGKFKFNKVLIHV